MVPEIVFIETTSAGVSIYEVRDPDTKEVIGYNEIYPRPTQTPLDTLGVMATLNAVLGLWSVEDAARTVGLTPTDLINEAHAWAAAQTPAE